MDKASFFILNIFFNSWLSFVTVVVLMESLIFLFRIKQGRLAATLRMMAIFKLPLDLCLYDFSKWAYAQGINPMNCEEGTRTLCAMFGETYSLSQGLFWPVGAKILLMVPGELTFTIGDLIGYFLDPVMVKGLALLWVFMTLLGIFRKLFVYYQSLTALQALKKHSQPLYKGKKNSLLSFYMKQYGVKILTSTHLRGSPFVAGFTSSIIYIPSQLSKSLSKKEYEAVLAHEIEHVRYRDNLVRLVIDFIRAIFWWIPTQSLCDRIEEGQEVGCDLTCKKYAVSPIDLASAICKAAKSSIANSSPSLVHQLAKPTIQKRVELLLQTPSIRFKKIRGAWSGLAFVVAFSVILLGKFWIF